MPEVSEERDTSCDRETDSVALDGVTEWLKRFSRCVRDLDFDAARDLIDPDVIAFGTLKNVITGVDEWERAQFRHVWPSTRDFEFELQMANCLIADDEKMVVVIAPWTSTGFHEDGTSFERPGRATLVLRRTSESAWRCTHSHMSLFKDVPQKSFAP